MEGNCSPLVSVAIPAYKQKYLAEAIRSVLNQSYQNIELIIVNDRSPEDIDGVVSQFNDARIRYYVNEQNLGGTNPANNWNKCLSYAQGEFFALLCDDDLYEPDFIEQMMSLASKYPKTNVFRARANFIDKEGKETNRYASAPEWESWDDYLWHVCHNYRSQTISEWMYRREAIINAGGYALLPLAWYADYLSIFRFAKEGGIASTFHILVHFRLSGENISSKDNSYTAEKIEATYAFRDAVAGMLNGSAEKEQTLRTLDKLLKFHTKLALNNARKMALIKLLFNKKKYPLPTRWIVKAIF